MRIFGKTDAEIDRIVADRKVEFDADRTEPDLGPMVARNAAPGPDAARQRAGALHGGRHLDDVDDRERDRDRRAAYRLGQPVEVRVPAYPDEVFKGHVTTLGAIIDPKTHRQLVRSEIEDPEHLLRAGMFANFVIRIGDPVSSLACRPNGVVREGDGTMTVWVTTDGRHFVKRTVKIGLQQDGWDQILMACSPANVVTDGAIFLSNKLLLGDAG